MINKFINTIRKYLGSFERAELNEPEEDQTKLNTTPFDLRQVFSDIRIDYNSEIEEPPNFNSESNFHILLVDDNKGALALLEMDIEAILGHRQAMFPEQFVEKKLNIFNKIIKKYNITFEIQAIGGDYAPYSVYKKLLSSEEYRIDFAIIDIIYGTVVYDKDKPLKIDGIDLAKVIRKINPEAEIILFTGSDLLPSSKEYKKIIELFGEKFLETNLLFKSPDYNARLLFFIKRIKMAFGRHLKSLRGKS